jgi:hypothetical protein
MAKETLNIELDGGLVERVRRYSEQHGTDVSGTIRGWIESLPSGAAEAANGAAIGSGPAAEAGEEDWVRNLPPITRSLLGIGRGDADEDDYREYLWRTHGP